MHLARSLQRRALSWGAELYGVADLSKVKFAHGDAYLRGVSMAVRFPETVVHELALGPSNAYRHFYGVLNALLDQLALRVTNYLEREGWKAYPVPASLFSEEGGLLGAFQHKTAAHLAGLGWIGRNCLLITPQLGPRVRLVTVLTDAPLPPGNPIPERCGTCRACVAACPAQALQGVSFTVQDDLSKRIDVFRCHEYMKQVESQGGVRVCGQCVRVCPWGHR